MADYKEIAVSGREYQRHRRLVIDNPVGNGIVFNFVEEKVTELTGLPVEVTPVSNLTFPYVSTETFIIYNSSTGEPYASSALNALVDNGQIRFKMSFLKEVILSLYKAKVTQRDGT